MAYATITDLEARWRPLNDSEKAVATTLLEDAAVYLDKQAPGAAADALKIVSCNMVKRAMATTGADLFGVSQGTISADVYSQTFTYSNPAGDMYLTKQDKALLGIGGGGIVNVRPLINGYYGGNNAD